MFVALAVAGLAVAAGIFSTPDKKSSAQGEPLARQVAGLNSVLTSRAFWRYAPQSTLIVGGFMALQGLWAVPWLMNFSGLAREAAAHHLLLMAGGMLAGFLAIAFGVTPLAKRGLGPEKLLTWGMGLGLLATLLIVLGVGPSQPLWLSLGLVFSVGNLAYALLQANYGPELAGRVNTALNLMVLPRRFRHPVGLRRHGRCSCRPPAMHRASAYQMTFGGLLALQVTSWLWFLQRSLELQRVHVEMPAQAAPASSAHTAVPSTPARKACSAGRLSDSTSSWPRSRVIRRCRRIGTGS